MIYRGRRDVRLERVPDPSVREATDALVRITRTAICGSDLHLWHAPTLPGAAPGFAVGHEFIGIVEDVGPGVEHVRRGERVLVSAVTGCGTCEMCRGGLQSACPVTTAHGSRTNVFGFGHGLPGGQAEAARVPFADANLLAVPAGVSDDAALLLTDILPTAYLGTELARVGAGDVVVVFGCGPVGALAQMCANVRRAARVIAVEPDAGRLALAKARGCDVVDPTREDVAEQVRALTHGRGADAVIEAVGRPELIASAIEIARPGGRIAVIGVVTEPVTIPWSRVFAKSLSLHAGLVSPQAFAAPLLAWVQDGRLDPTSIITHRLPLDEGPRGYALFAAHAEGALKVVLAP
jgi:threonine dehydrogenase-like Zn-dependent dehydrogenase